MLRRYLILAILLSVGIQLSPLQAAILSTDSFETYTTGTTLNGNNGGTGFSGAYAVPAGNQSSVLVVNQNLSYSGGTVSVNGGNQAVQITGAADSANLIARSFASLSSDPIYFSFLYRTNSTTEAFLQFGLSDTNVNEPRASVGLQGFNGVNTNSEAFFVRVPNAGTSGYAPSTIAANTTYFVVGKISKDSGSSTFNKIDLFVNPTSDIEPAALATATAAVNTGASSFNNFILRAARTDSGNTYTFDAFTIGDTFADVVPVPEPSTLALSVVAPLAFLGVLRLRHKRA